MPAAPLSAARSVSLLLLLVVFLLSAAPARAEAQSSGLGWLRGIERWTHQEDYRTWIGHGVVTAASTLFGHWVFGKAHYGAGAAVMFYVGVEYQELRRDDWVVNNKLDKFMDLAVPITVGSLLVVLLSDDAPSAPPLLPRPLSAEELEGELLLLRLEGVDIQGRGRDLALLPALPFRRSEPLPAQPAPASPSAGEASSPLPPLADVPR